MDGNPLAPNPALDRPLNQGIRWAWEIASHGAAPLSALESSAVRRMASFLVRREAAKASGRPWNDSSMPAAITLRIAGDSSRRLAAELEALLLAEARPEQIAERTGVQPAVSQLYAELFYDVADRLSYPALMLEMAILPELDRGPVKTAKRRFAQKVVGYFCGVKGLDDFYPMHVSPVNQWMHPLELIDRVQTESTLTEWLYSRLTLDPSAFAPADRALALAEAVKKLLPNLARERYPVNRLE